jgi:hypothetical protein
MSSGGNPSVSVNIRDGPGRQNNNPGGIVQNLINNSGPREATPLLATASAGDYAHHHEVGRWVLGVLDQCASPHLSSRPHVLPCSHFLPSIHQSTIDRPIGPSIHPSIHPSIDQPGRERWALPVVQGGDLAGGRGGGGGGAALRPAGAAPRQGRHGALPPRHPPPPGALPSTPSTHHTETERHQSRADRFDRPAPTETHHPLFTPHQPNPPPPTPCQPTALWGAVRRPYPTGAWWTNLVLGKGDNNVAQLPYAIKTSNADGVQVCACVMVCLWGVCRWVVCC